MFRKVKRYWFNLMHPVIGEVWQLHRVTNEHSVQKKHSPYEITPERLECLITEYCHKGYEFISISEVAERMSSPGLLKFVCVTLDDGYADNYEIAYPIFRKYNMPFCIYLCENMILGEKREDCIENYRFLSIGQIQDLAKDSLCTIGCHTRNHLRLSTLTADEQFEEIMHCKDWAEGVCGKAIEDFAFPYGDYSPETIMVLRNAGIKRAVASWGGCVRRNTPDKILEIPRLLVTEMGNR